jgi:hypothetical protein
VPDGAGDGSNVLLARGAGAAAEGVAEVACGEDGRDEAGDPQATRRIIKAVAMASQATITELNKVFRLNLVASAHDDRLLYCITKESLKG